MARRSVRISWSSGRGSTWRAGGSNVRSNHRRPARSTPSDKATVDRDPTDLFRRAHDWLDQIEKAVRAATGNGASTTGPEPRTETGTDEGHRQAGSAGPPAEPPPVELPDAPLEGTVPSLAIEFHAPSYAPRFDLPFTRFGGQPDWLSQPQWPVSRSLAKPMEFVGQLALHPDDFPWLHEPKMAYLFVTNDEEDPGGIEIWHPFAGENAVIVQPGETPGWIRQFSTEPTGPSVGPEVSVRLTPRSDPELLDNAQMGELGRRDRDLAHHYSALLDYDKVGGTPNFFQGLEFPDFTTRTTATDPSTATPILMVTDDDATGLNLGDAGRGVAFLSPDQRQGAYLWFN